MRRNLSLLLTLAAVTAVVAAGALVIGIAREPGPPPADSSPANAVPSVDALPTTKTLTPGPSSAPPSAPAATAPDVLPGATRPGTLPPVVDHGPRTGNKVALTFDADMTDGMLRNLRTGRVKSYANVRIIDLLEREQVPATFFLTGKWVEQYPDLTRRIAGNPRFELANHTYGHLAFTDDCYDLPRLPPEDMAEDVAKTFAIIERYGGRQTRYFRFPGLCHDDRALAALAPLGLTVVDGDVVSGDPFATSWRPIVHAVLSKVRLGSIIILHVTEANAAMTDEALPHILAGLRDRGLSPATLSEVLAES